jgi:hypothetical protein
MTKASNGGLPQATESLNKMDGYLSTEDRQEGIALAASGDYLKSRAAPPTRPAAVAVAAAEPMPVKPAPAKPVAEAKPPVKLAAAEAKPSVKAEPKTPVKLAAASPSKPATKPAPKPVRVAVATPAPKPMPAKPAPAAPKAAPAAGHGWVVQLGAFSNRGAAAGAWGTARGKVGALGRIAPAYVQAGKVVRLRAGSFADKGAAENICKAAARAGQSCFVAAN